MSKKKSKRMTIHLQNKIKKKVTEARRKQRKEARLNPQKTTRKDPGIPNMFPFKDELLTQIENHKAMLSHEKEEEKEARHKAKLKKSKMSLKREQNKLSRMDAPSQFFCMHCLSLADPFSPVFVPHSFRRGDPCSQGFVAALSVP